MGSTHLRAWLGIPGVRLCAVMDQNPKRLSGDLSDVIGNLGSGGERMDFSQVRQYLRPEEIVRDPGLDIVDICLPTNLHAPLAIEALQAGKHVLVEKPMALTGEECDRMIAAAKDAGRVLMTAQVLRFHPAYEALFALMDSGKFGPIRYAVFRRRCAAPTWGPWEFDPSQSGGGVFDLVIHDVDACLHAFGPPQAIRAGGYEAMARGIDTIVSNFEYPGFGLVLITGGWHHIGAYPFSMEYTVVADGGTAEFSTLGRPATVYWADGTQETLEGAEVDWYRAEIEYFLQCCANGSHPDRCPPEESAAAVKLTRMMLESRAKQGERIACGLTVAV
ncbi:MAG: Gfo/Idh/MocA family oxidoreductase [Bryobacterales bacterium]|nr:Gfo/Idh/MocA family oxidoreductase [Bryobacterales bacterium]